MRLAISITGVGSLLKPWYKRCRRAILLLMSFFSVKPYLEEDKDLLLFQLITALGERIPRVDIPAKGMSSRIPESRNHISTDVKMYRRLVSWEGRSCGTSSNCGRLIGCWNDLRDDVNEREVLDTEIFLCTIL